MVATQELYILLKKSIGLTTNKSSSISYSETSIVIEQCPLQGWKIGRRYSRKAISRYGLNNWAWVN